MPTSSSKTEYLDQLIEEASDRLFSLILQKQYHYQGIETKDKVQNHDQLIAEFSELRGQSFAFPFIPSGNGHGPFIEDISGQIKMDLTSGLGPNLIGYSHPLQIRSQLEAAEVNMTSQNNLFPSQSAAKLGQKLIEAAQGSKLKHFWFTGNGTMANEHALRLALLNTPSKNRVLIFDGSFTGRSLAMSELSQINKPSIDGHFKIDFISYDNPLDQLESLWLKYPNQFSVICFELIQGHAGVRHLPTEIIHDVVRWCKNKNILIWIDEVQTIGRTTELFAFQTFGIQSYVDIVTVGKALNISGILFNSQLRPKETFFGGTLCGGTANIIYAEKLLHYLTQGNFYGKSGRIASLEKKFFTKLKQIHDQLGSNIIDDIVCQGTLISFKIGDGSFEKTCQFLKVLFENGIIGFLGQKDHCKIRLLIPISLRDEHISQIFLIITKSLSSVFGD